MINSVPEQLNIFTERHLLQELYSSSSKIIISTKDKDIFLDALGKNSIISIYEFASNNSVRNILNNQSDLKLKLPQATILALEPESKNQNNLVEIKLAPSFCLAFLAFSEAGKEELTELINWWWQKSLEVEKPKIIELDKSKNSVELQKEFWQQMFVLMNKKNNLRAKRIATLQKQYLGLRTLHEDMQNAFATVEDYLSQAKLPPIQLAFDAQPIDKSLEPTTIANSNSAIAKQLLPVSSRGLTGIELHIAKQYNQAVGYLRISLKACEDTTSIALWQIPYSHISTGWLGLDLPTINLGRKRDLELTVEWHTELGPAPALSLTKLQPIPEARVYSDNLILEHSLSLRIWQGLPGTRKVTSPYLLITEGDREPLPQLGYLGQRAMASVQEVTPNLPTDDFEHIQVLEDGAKIMTHPRGDGTATIAMLSDSFPPTANQLTASIATEHPEAGTIEYAIAIIEPETDPKTAFNSQVALSCSDWIAVEPNTPRQIVLNLDRTVSQHCHIVIATRLVAGSPTDFAWSHWLNFHSAVVEPTLSLTSSSLKSIIDLKQTQLRDATLNSAQSKFPKVQLIEKENKIQVHPSQDGDSVAVLPNVIQPGVTKVKSTVCTENETASVIEYAIAIITTDDDVAARLAINSPRSAVGFSGWQKVAANTPHQLEINSIKPITDICHLVLATRLPKNSSQTNAWARWLHIEYITSSQNIAKVLIEN